MSAIGKDELKKLMRLARLELPSEKTDEALRALNDILGMMEQLQQAEVEDVDAFAQPQFRGHPLRLREDRATAGYQQEELLRQAKQSDHGCFMVPKVIE